MVQLHVAHDYASLAAIPFEGKGLVQARVQVKALELAPVDLDLDRLLVARAVDDAGNLAFSANRAVLLAQGSARFGHENQWCCHLIDSYYLHQSSIPRASVTRARKNATRVAYVLTVSRQRKYRVDGVRMSRVWFPISTLRLEPP